MRKIPNKLYIMKCLEFYKIGITHNPRARESTIQSSNPTEVRLINYFELPKKLNTRRLCIEFEESVHQSFSSKKVRGEWYALDSEDIETIEDSFKDD